MKPSIQVWIGDWLYFFSICSGMAAILQVWLTKSWTTKSTEFIVMEIVSCACFIVSGKIFKWADNKIPMNNYREIFETIFLLRFPEKKLIA